MKKLLILIIFTYLLYGCYNYEDNDYYPLYVGTVWSYISNSDTSQVISYTVEGIEEYNDSIFYKIKKFNYYTSAMDSFFVYKDRNCIKLIYEDSIVVPLQFPLIQGDKWIYNEKNNMSATIVTDTVIYVDNYVFNNVVYIKTEDNTNLFFAKNVGLIKVENNDINMYLKSVIWGQ